MRLMSRAAVSAPSVVVDIAVTLTAIVRAESDAGGYSASIPALPGCHTQGETLDEVRANLREAAEGWLAVAHNEALARGAARGSGPKTSTQRAIMQDAGLTDNDL